MRILLDVGVWFLFSMEVLLNYIDLLPNLFIGYKDIILRIFST